MKKILFIHVPKTAGTSLYRTFKLDRIVRHATINYLEIKENVNMDQFWTIGSVRNPWARIWSYFNWTFSLASPRHKMEWKKWLFNPPKDLLHYKDVLNNNPLKQSNYFINRDGAIVIDEIINLHTIQDDIKKSQYLNAKITTYNKKGTGDNWHSAYDEEAKEYVREISLWEINKFGFKFDD